MEVKVKAPAKINLALDIKGKRADGYHNVEMVMQAINLFDIVTVRDANHNDIKVNINKELDINYKNNTAYKAAVEFFKHSKIKNPGIDIHIEKNIPIAAGLAGGSSDAAGTLVALNKIFNTSYPNSVLAEIGAKIGADVPFCIYGGTMLATGIGTELKTLPSPANCIFVLTKPPISVSTAKAYSLVDEVVFFDYRSVNKVVNALKQKNIEKLANSVFNRFEQVLSIDEVTNIGFTAYEYSALSSCMSGSGPTVFSIFTDIESAKDCVIGLKKTYKDVFLCSPIETGCTIF